MTCPHHHTTSAPRYTCRTGRVETVLITYEDCGAEWIEHSRRYGSDGPVGQVPNRLPAEADEHVEQEVE